MASEVHDALRERLREVLLEGRRQHERLLAFVDDPETSAALLADQVIVLRKLADEGDALVRELRRVASESGEDSRPPVRQLILSALDEVGTPQDARALQQYIWARDRVHLDTRSFASIRRDERRSWQKNPGKRRVYIAPALSVEGKPLAHWMTRSDWELERRVIPSPETERLLDMELIKALYEKQSQDVEDEIRSPFDAPLEEYAEKVLGIAPPIAGTFPQERAGPTTSERASRTLEAWRYVTLRMRLKRALEQELPPLEKRDRAARNDAARRLTRLSAEEQLWGREEKPSSSRPGTP